MYKWNIDIILKGSGHKIDCLYEGPEDTSSDVIINNFNHKPLNEMIAFRSGDNKHQVFISVGEIAAIDIYQKGRR
jgi:hypothetical protein